MKYRRDVRNMIWHGSSPMADGWFGYPDDVGVCCFAEGEALANRNLAEVFFVAQATSTC